MAKALGSTSTITWNAVAVTHVKSITFSGSVTAVDATDNSTNNVKQYLPGDEDGTCAITVNYDPGDAVQGNMLTDFYAKTARTVVYRPTVGAGNKQYTFSAYITGFSVPSGHEGVLEATIDMQITDGVTVSTQ